MSHLPDAATAMRLFRRLVQVQPPRPLTDEQRLGHQPASPRPVFHRCTNACIFLQDGTFYVCRHTGNLHQCTEERCDRLTDTYGQQQNVESLVCELTSLAYERDFVLPFDYDNADRKHPWGAYPNVGVIAPNARVQRTAWADPNPTTTTAHPSLPSTNANPHPLPVPSPARSRTRSRCRPPAAGHTRTSRMGAWHEQNRSMLQPLLVHTTVRKLLHAYLQLSPAQVHALPQDQRLDLDQLQQTCWQWWILVTRTATFRACMGGGGGGSGSAATMLCGVPNRLFLHCVVVLRHMLTGYRASTDMVVIGPHHGVRQFLPPTRRLHARFHIKPRHLTEAMKAFTTYVQELETTHPEDLRTMHRRLQLRDAPDTRHGSIAPRM